MAADGKVVIDVILDDGKVAKGIANVDKSLGGLDRTAQKGVFTIGKLVAALGLIGLAKKGIDMVRNALDGAIDRYDTLNAFPAVMQQIGFDAEKSRKAIQRLSDGVQGLPTTLDSVAKTAQRIAVMTGDLDGAVETTLALNNAFIASGSSIADAQRGLEQYVQMLAKGEVDLQSWRTLQETMGVALNDVAKAFGFAGKSAQNDLYEALKNGEITFDQFNEKIIELSNQTGGFADRARTASGGIRTAWTNMRTAVVRGVTDILASIDSVLKGTRFKSIENVIVRMGQSFYSALNRIAEAIPRVYEALRPWIPLISGIAAAFGTLVTSMAIYGTIIRLQASFITLIGVIKGTTTATTGFQRAITFLAKTPMLLVVSALAGLAVAIVHAYKTFEPFRNVINRIGSTLKTAFAPIIVRVGELISGLRERFENFASTKGVSILESLARVFVKLATAAASFIESKILPFLESFADAIGKAFSGDLSGVTSLFAQLVPTIVSVLLGGIPALVLTAAKFLPAIAEGITNNLPTILNAITNVATSIIQAFATHFPMLIETGVQILDNLIQGLSIAIPKVLPVVIVAITKILETAATLLPQFIDMGLQIFLNLIHGLTSALPQIVEVVLVIITTLLTTLVEHLPMIVETGTYILLALVEGVIQLLPVLVDTGLQLLLTIVETLVENLPMIIDAGIRVLTSLIDGIGQIIPQLIPLALNIIVTLAAALIMNLPKIIDAGIRILRALIEGVIKILPQLIQLALRLIVELASALIRNLPKIIAAGVEILLKLISGIIKALPQLLKIGGELVVNLAKAIVKNVPNMLNVGKDLVKGLIRGINGMTSKAIEAVTGVVNGVIEKAKSLLKISSPSKLFEQYGKWTGEGLVIGIESMQKAAEKASEKLGLRVDNALKSRLQIDGLRSLRGPTTNAVLAGYIPNTLQVTQQLIENTKLRQQQPVIKLEVGDVIMDGRKVGEIVWRPVKENIDRDTKITESFRGW